MKRLLFIIISTSAISYCLFNELNSLQITRHQLYLPIAREIKIALLADIHMTHYGQLEKKVISAITREKPDMILIAGDLVSSDTNPFECQQFLTALKAPMGKYFVMGNWEYWHPLNNFQSLLANAKVTILNNQNRKISQNLYLIGFDDLYEGQVDIKSAFWGIPPDSFKIALFHTPQFFNQIALQVDLAFAGHGHGGQIALPFWGPLLVPYGVGKFTSGWFAQKLYVSRGIGTSILPIRLGVRPEIAIINLHPK